MLTELNTTRRLALDVLCAASSPSLVTQAETAVASYSKVCATEGSAWETTAWKMTPHSGNMAKLMGGSVEENKSMRDSLHRAIDLDGENWCEVLHGRLIVIPDRTAEDED